MKRLFVVIVLCVLSCYAATAQMNETPCVEVAGYAFVEVEPNEIWLRITIEEKDPNANEKLYEKEKMLFKQLGRLKVDIKSSLFVESYSGNSYKRNGTILSKSYKLRLSDADMVKKTFDALNIIGINKVLVLSTSRNDVSELKSKLRVEAMRNAKARATELAQAIEQSIGSAIYINDYNSDSSPIMLRSVNKSLTMGADVVDEVVGSPEFSNIKLEYRVTVKFRLLEN